jgi:hypothetical protein
MIMKIKSYLLTAAIVLSVASCKKDKNDDNTPTEQTPYQSGVFVSCEGPFQTGSGTISFLNRSTKVVSNDIFQTVNGRPLGNVVQSINVYNGKGYIVVNNAGKVEVVSIGDFKSVGKIDGLTSPRYFIGLNSSKGYVSDMSGSVAVVDLSSNTVVKTISNGRSPDQMEIVNDKLFVLNYGGLGTDSTITVINTQSDTVEATVNVYYKPNSIKVDANGKLWVMCGGRGYTGYPQVDDTPGHLLCIDPSTYNIEKDLAFPATGDHPEHMVIDKESATVYYLDNNKVYAFGLNSAVLSTTALISRSFYALGYDGVEDYLYAGDPVDYASNGWVYRYHANNGTSVDSFRVGIIPGNFYFN